MDNSGHSRPRGLRTRSRTLNRGRIALLAGRVRVTLGLLGVGSAPFEPTLRPLLPGFVAYLVVAIGLQTLIARRALSSISRVLSMGIFDLLFASVVVHMVGSLSSSMPAVYVAVPVLYATTTSRRRVSASLTASGVVMYAAIVALELYRVVPYAPLTGAAMPSVGVAVASVALIAVCAFPATILTARLILALERANSRLHDISQHDELTGLFNRRYVMQRIEEEIARAARSQSKLTLAMLDLDGFKRVNDEAGHETGDAVLVAVADALRRATRKVDVVARLGGDEFIIVFPDTDAEGVRAVAGRVLSEARMAAMSACPTIVVTMSIGVSEAEPSDDAASILRRVDEKLYLAKHRGGDRVV